jgi:biotin carboxyl carrier protein
MWRAAGKCFARSHRRTLRATAGAASSSSCGVAAAGGKSLDTPPASVFATPLSRQPAVKDARAFFAVRCMSSAAHDGSHGGWAVKMPQITEDESFGKLTVWLKKEGEAVSPGDQLCEVECTDFGFSLSAEESGWIAQILVPEGGDKVPVGSPLCVLVDRQQDIPLYLADHEAKAAAGQFSFSTKDLMLAIGRILRKNKVNHGTHRTPIVSFCDCTIFA